MKFSNFFDPLSISNLNSEVLGRVDETVLVFFATSISIQL
jgi:hypothetical protein